MPAISRAARPRAQNLNLLDGTWSAAQTAGVSLFSQVAGGAHPIQVAAQSARPHDEISLDGALWTRPLLDAYGRPVTAGDLGALSVPKVLLEVTAAPPANSGLAILHGYRNADGDVWLLSGVGYGGSTGGIQGVTSLSVGQASADSVTWIRAQTLFQAELSRIAEIYGSTGGIQRVPANGDMGDAGDALDEVVALSIASAVQSTISIQFRVTTAPLILDPELVP